MRRTRPPDLAASRLGPECNSKSVRHRQGTTEPRSAMVRYDILTDERQARAFFQLVQEHLYWEEAVVDETAPNQVAIRRRPMPQLDLFSRRGTFIAAIAASDEGKTVGLYALADHTGKAHIDVGYVVSKYRRHGVG